MRQKESKASSLSGRKPFVAEKIQKGGDSYREQKLSVKKESESTKRGNGFYKRSNP